jgi:hypothetical protein
MQNINTIARLNAQQRADLDNSRNGTYCVLRHGGVLLRSGVTSKTLDNPDEVKGFLAQVRGKHSGIVRKVVQSFFAPSLQPA